MVVETARAGASFTNYFMGSSLFFVYTQNIHHHPLHAINYMIMMSYTVQVVNGVYAV